MLVSSTKGEKTRRTVMIELCQTLAGHEGDRQGNDRLDRRNWNVQCRSEQVCAPA